MKNPIYPCLWFDGKAAEAADYYCSIFPNSKVVSANPMVTVFELNGQKIMALNGGPQFTFTEAISYVVECSNQEEIDQYWNKLIADGGSEGRCGWCKDKYGMSWQIVPHHIGSLIGGNSEKHQRAMQVMMKMNKLIITELEEA